MLFRSVFVKEVKNIGEYLVNINTVGNWDKKDRLTVAALTSEEAGKYKVT